MSYDDVRIALETRLSAYQAANVAWQNVEFKPSPGVGYLEPSLLIATPAMASVGTGGVDRHSGIFQIDVIEHKNTGPGSAMQKADAIAAQFTRGLALVSNAVTVTIERSWPAAGFNRDDWFVVPVSVSWFSYF